MSKSKGTMFTERKGLGRLRCKFHIRQESVGTTNTNFEPGENPLWLQVQGLIAERGTLG